MYLHTHFVQGGILATSPTVTSFTNNTVWHRKYIVIQSQNTHRLHSVGAEFKIKTLS
jgi:hypothetical protein